MDTNFLRSPVAVLALTGGLAAQAAGTGTATDTAPASRWYETPFRVEADGGPIAVPTGHAAPFLRDCDGDGVRDLVVGSFGSDAEDVRGGTCRVYRNHGTDGEPRFTTFTLLQSDGRPATMPSS